MKIQSLEGFEVSRLTPIEVGGPSPMGMRTQTLHPILTAETHNFPTYVLHFVELLFSIRCVLTCTYVHAMCDCTQISQFRDTKTCLTEHTDTHINSIHSAFSKLI